MLSSRTNPLNTVHVTIVNRGDSINYDVTEHPSQA